MKNTILGDCFISLITRVKHRLANRTVIYDPRIDSKDYALTNSGMLKVFQKAQRLAKRQLMVTEMAMLSKLIKAGGIVIEVVEGKIKAYEIKRSQFEKPTDEQISVLHDKAKQVHTAAVALGNGAYMKDGKTKRRERREAERQNKKK